MMIVLMGVAVVFVMMIVLMMVGWCSCFHRVLNCVCVYFAPWRKIQVCVMFKNCITHVCVLAGWLKYMYVF